MYITYGKVLLNKTGAARIFLAKFWAMEESSPPSVDAPSTSPQQPINHNTSQAAYTPLQPSIFEVKYSDGTQNAYDAMEFVPSRDVTFQFLDCQEPTV